MCGVAFISGCSSVQFGVLFVGNGLAPFVAAIFAGNFHSNVAEPAVGLGTVPVLDVGRDVDHGAGGQADGRFALFLVPAFACGAGILCDRYIFSKPLIEKNCPHNGLSYRVRAVDLWQYRIILSADTASEVRQLLSQKRR